MRHTLFVRLSGEKITYMAQANDSELEFADQNGVDEKEPFEVASFNIGDFDISTGEDGLKRTNYLVFARALGKPVSEVKITPDATFTDASGNDAFYLREKTLKRSRGEPGTEHIADLFYVDVDVYDANENLIGTYRTIIGSIITGDASCFE